MIASTYELGLENQGCQEMQSGGYLQVEYLFLFKKILFSYFDCQKIRKERYFAVPSLYFSFSSIYLSLLRFRFGRF